MTNELEHHGIIGQKWGVRRFQKKNGALTSAGKKKLRKQREKIAKKKEKEEAKEAKIQESIDDRRSRVLKSSDPEEIYKNRDILTTAEIKDRLDRIDTEKRLSKAVAESKPYEKTTKDYINDMVSTAKTINEIYKVTQLDMFKALRIAMKAKNKEQYGYSPDLADAYKNRNRLNDDKLQKIISRAEKENKLGKLAKGQVDDDIDDLIEKIKEQRSQ